MYITTFSCLRISVQCDNVSSHLAAKSGINGEKNIKHETKKKQVTFFLVLNIGVQTMAQDTNVSLIRSYVP